MRSNYLVFGQPLIEEAEIEEVVKSLRAGWLGTGPKVAEFERLFADRVGAKFGVATTSCTTAMHLALLVAGIGEGDEVICPSYSFVATANAILYAGATPVFADIDRHTWNIDPDDAMRKITAKTKAIMPVHQVGLAADLDRFAPAKARGITIIEDAACAIGATYRGRTIGSHGHISCFSFHPRKTICVGEGGMLMTDDAAVADHARRLRSHGASVSDHARHQAKGLVYEEYRELGYNYRMTDLQAAIGLAQLPKLERFLERRRAIAARYDAAFGSHPELQVPARPAYADHAYQSYAVMLTDRCGLERDEAMRALAACGVSCRRGIPPIHLEPLYRDRSMAPLPVTELVAARSIFLPIYAGLADADQTRVIEAVTGLVGRTH